MNFKILLFINLDILNMYINIAIYIIFPIYIPRPILIQIMQIHQGTWKKTPFFFI